MRRRPISHKLVEYGGERVVVSKLADRCGVDRKVFYLRLRRGWTIGRAMTTPIVTGRWDRIRGLKRMFKQNTGEELFVKMLLSKIFCRIGVSRESGWTEELDELYCMADSLLLPKYRKEWV